MVQGIPSEDPSRQATHALILVPTRELSEQVYTHLVGFLKYCEQEVTVANASTASSTQLQKYVHSFIPFPSPLYSRYAERSSPTTLTL